MRKRTLAFIFAAALGSLFALPDNLDLATSTARAQDGPDLKFREELQALEEAKRRKKEEARRAEEEKQREEDQRRAAEAQGPPPPEPVPSGGAGAGTAASPPPCKSSGGGADDCAGQDGVVDPGVKTLPGNFDIYKK